MSAEYVSPKQDGYMNVRNEIYRDREKKQQVMANEMQAANRPVPMTQANYGFGKINYK